MLAIVLNRTRPNLDSGGPVVASPSVVMVHNIILLSVYIARPYLAQYETHADNTDVPDCSSLPNSTQNTVT